MRGLYGQSEGNESRSQSAQLEERFLDNDIVEGQHVVVLHRMVKERCWQQVTAYTEKLKKSGHGPARIESMMSRAMHGLKF